MTDNTLLQSSVTLAEKTLDTVDDILKALIEALSAKSTKEQHTVLERFSAHIDSGGTLNAIQLDTTHLKNFDEAAKALDLDYYPITDNEKATILLMDKDVLSVNAIADELAKQGKPLYRNPQIPISDFMERHKNSEIVYVQVDNLSAIDAAKQRASEANLEFSVCRRADCGYIVVFDKQSQADLVAAGIIPDQKSAKALFSTITMSDAKSVVKKMKEAVNAQQLEKNFSKQL